MKRILLFLATNLAIMVTLSIVLALAGHLRLHDRPTASTTRR